MYARERRKLRYIVMKYITNRQNPNRFRVLTGISVSHFDELLPYFADAHWEYFRYYKYDGKPNKGIRPPRIYKNSPLPSVEDRLYFILYYLKNNPLQEAMAEMWDMETAVCNRWIHCLYGILRTALEEMGVAPASTKKDLEKLYQRLDEPHTAILIHDGTERPVPRPADPDIQVKRYSGKKKTHTVKNGVIASVMGAILFVSQTVCGTVHDKIIADNQYCFPTTSMVLQDTGYQGYAGDWTTYQPFKRTKGKALQPYQKEWNRYISSIRVKIEHQIGSAKIMRIVKDECRVRNTLFVNSAFHVAAAIHNLRIGVKLPLNR